MKLHHIGIAVDDIDKAIQRHKALFGLHPVTEVVEDPIQKVSVVLLSAFGGEVFIELVAPLAKDSPISNFLKRGIHLYHVCYLVEDLEKTLEEVRQDSLIISKPAPAKLYGGRRIAFIYAPDGYVVEFLEEKEKPDAHK